MLIFSFTLFKQFEILREHHPDKITVSSTEKLDDFFFLQLKSLVSQVNSPTQQRWELICMLLLTGYLRCVQVLKTLITLALKNFLYSQTQLRMFFPFLMITAF